MLPHPVHTHTHIHTYSWDKSLHHVFNRLSSVFSFTKLNLVWYKERNMEYQMRITNISMLFWLANHHPIWDTLYWFFFCVWSQQYFIYLEEWEKISWNQSGGKVTYKKYVNMSTLRNLFTFLCCNLLCLESSRIHNFSSRHNYYNLQLPNQQVRL